jgi:hypothetical protein
LLILLSLTPYVVFITVDPLILKSLIDDAIIPRNVRLVGILTALLVSIRSCKPPATSFSGCSSAASVRL